MRRQTVETGCDGRVSVAAGGTRDAHTGYGIPDTGTFLPGTGILPVFLRKFYTGKYRYTGTFFRIPELHSTHAFFECAFLLLLPNEFNTSLIWGRNFFPFPFGQHSKKRVSSQLIFNNIGDGGQCAYSQPRLCSQL